MTIAARELLADAASRPITGWDFSALGDRLSVRPLPWDFAEIAARQAATSPDLLDLETGGGEWLSSLPHRPPRTVATEPWAPNAAVARTRLEPLGVTVVDVEPPPDNVDQRDGDGRGTLPFPSASFSLVTSRHAAYVPSEVARVLRSEGEFLTQQVGGDYRAFHELLGLPHHSLRSPVWNVAFASQQLAASGLEVTDSAEAHEDTVFADVGAFAWYLRAVPWVVPGFTIDAYRPALEGLHARFEDGPITVGQPAFWLRAVKRG